MTANDAMNAPINLEALQVLEAIDQHGGFAAAARATGRAPSAISYTVSKLESDLGVTLFRREGRRSVPTNAGHALLAGGRALLAQADALAARVIETAEGWEPRLRIVVDVVAPLEPLYKALAGLPDHVLIGVSEAALGGTWEALLADRADLIVGAVAGLPEAYQGTRQGIRRAPWHVPDLVFAVAPSHPLAGTDLPVDQAALDACRPVIVRDSATAFAALSRGFAAKGTPAYVPNMFHKLIAQRQGLGVGLLPRRLAEADLQAGRLVELKLAEPPASEPTLLAWRTNHHGKALRQVIDALQSG